jgi:hypothetical protein
MSDAGTKISIVINCLRSILAGKLAPVTGYFRSRYPGKIGVTGNYPGKSRQPWTARRILTTGNDKPELWRRDGELRRRPAVNVARHTRVVSW